MDDFKYRRSIAELYDRVEGLERAESFSFWTTMGTWAMIATMILHG